MFVKTLFVSLIDQLFVALSPLLLTVYFSKELSITEFGFFSTVLSYLTLGGALLGQLIVEPAIVLGSRNKTRAIGAAWLSTTMIILLGLIVFLIYIVINLMGVDFPNAVLVLLLSEAVFSTWHLFRRVSYLSQSGRALMLSSASFILALALLSFIELSLELSLMGASVVRLVVFAFPVLFSSRAFLSKKMWTLKRQLVLLNYFFSYSKPYLLGAVIFWVTNSASVALVGSVLSLEDASGYRIALLILVPITLIGGALHQFLLPKYSNELYPTSVRLFHFLLYVLPALLIAVGAYAIDESVLSYLFGADIGKYFWLVSIVVWLGVSDSVKQYLVLVAYAQDLRRSFLLYRLVSLILFVLLSLPAFLLKDLMLVATSIVFASVFSLLAMFLLIKKHRGKI